jgi:hypothetical protein
MPQHRPRLTLRSPALRQPAIYCGNDEDDAIIRRMRMPSATLRELRRAIWSSHPLWGKLYVLCVGLPSWAYLFYQMVIAGTVESPSFDVALAAFVTAALLEVAFLFRAFSQHEP